MTALKERMRRDPSAFVSRSKPTLSEEWHELPSPEVGENISLPAAQDKTYASRLPNLLTRFFGREQEQADLRDLLLHQQERLITVLGAGGAGKTRLALQIAHQLAPNFAGRVVFVSLADIASPLLLPVLLLNTLLLPMTPGEPLERVIFALSEKPTLLILDNMEHLLNDEGVKSENPFGNSGSVFVKRLLESVPNLSCLVTSRQSLHLEGEQEYYLPPLALPDEESLPQLQACASVALYVDRAQKAKADFVLTTHNAKAIARLCRKLEGMPLAVEMAAAWIKTLPPARMLERLERQLEVLISRRRDLPARQTSLRATCEWSYEQLPPRLRDAFARLSVFQGGWTLEAAEALIGRNALNVMAELQERSLLLCGETAEEEPRYRMLEPLREFAAEKLQETGEWEKVRDIHAQFFLDFAQQAGERFRSFQDQECLVCLRRDQDNLRTALSWWEHNDEPTALKLLVPLIRFWRLSGNFWEGSDWCARILTLPNTQERTLIRACALNEAGTLTALQTEYAKAKACHQEAYEIFLDCQDRRGQIRALNGLLDRQGRLQA